jgi:enoyl-CoA hydratase/carnithine racemase
VASSDPRILLTVSGASATLALDRADKRNALDQAMWEAIPGAVSAALDGGARLLLLRSTTPGVFCAGADIGEFARASADPVWRAANQAAIRTAQLALARCPIPTLALVDGDCVGGGCGLAIACDLRLASPRARFGITPARLGLVYSLHDTKLLVDLVGPANAKRMLFTGQLMPADEALRIGLVDEVAGDPDGAAAALAEQLVAASPASQRGIKEIVRRILDGATDDDAWSAGLFDSAFTGADFREGIAAFSARRSPRFAE